MPIPDSNYTIQRESAKSKIYQILCDWIVHGELKPGEKINISEFADHFNVSRTPIREALLMLEAQKFIEVTPGKGTVVTEINKSDVEKCYIPLAEIQGLAAELACKKFSSYDLQHLEDIYANFVKAIENEDIDDSISYDSAFHDYILNLADNEYLTEFSQVLILHIQRIKYHYFHHYSMRKSSAKQHREILDAFKEGNPAKVSSLMKSHWLNVMEKSLEHVEH